MDDKKKPAISEEMLALQAQLEQARAEAEAAKALLVKNDIKPLDEVITGTHKVESVEEGHALHGKNVKFKTGQNIFRPTSDDKEFLQAKLTKEQLVALYDANGDICWAREAIKLPVVMELLASKNFGGLEVVTE